MTKVFPFSVLPAVLLVGCEVGPNFHPPLGPVPLRYTEQPVGTARDHAIGSPAGGTQTYAVGRDVAGDWWTLFRSPALTALVAEAVAANPNLEAARQALRSSEELTLAQWSGLLPAVNGTFSRNRFGNYAGAIEGPDVPSSAFGYYDAQFTLTYTFDVWGGIRRGIENRVALADYQRSFLEATYLTLTGNVVATAINEASLAGQIAVQKELIADEASYLTTVQRQFVLGGATGTDVAQQQAQVAQQQALLPALETQLQQARDAMASYLGRVPAGNALPGFDLAQLALPQTVPLSVPALLVLHRPDVREAEANLHAATALVGVAEANRLPNFSLNAQWGTEALTAGGLFGPGSALSLLVNQVAQPVFAGGLLLHQQRAAVATMRQQAAIWEQTALGAFQNVADVLTQLENDGAALEAQHTAATAAARALSLAKLQYGFGGVSYLTVLTAEIADQQAQILLVRAEAARLGDTASLLVALGGGWWNRNDQPKPPDGVFKSLLPWSNA